MADIGRLKTAAVRAEEPDAAAVASAIRPAPEPPLVFVESLEVRFGGFRALRGVDFTLRRGELRFLIGPNGAGKTTLLDVLCGKTRPSAGRVRFKGAIDLAKLQEHEIAALGIGRKFQSPSIFAELTVWENIEIALKQPRGVRHALSARLSAEQRDRIARILERVGLADKPRVRGGTLSHGEKQWLEIGMLLAQDPELLLLDEPVAGMTDAETERTAELLRDIATDHTVLVVEHDMAFVRACAQTVTVMHEAAVLCEGSVADVQNDERVAEVYLGRRADPHA